MENNQIDNFDDVRHIQESDLTVLSQYINPNQRLQPSPQKSMHSKQPSQNAETSKVEEVNVSPGGNPMQSLPNLSQIGDNQDEPNVDLLNQEDPELQMKQVMTELTDPKVTISPPPEPSQPQRDQLEMHKQVLKSPRKESPSIHDPYQIQEQSDWKEQSVLKPNLREKYASDKAIEMNLREIYTFYAKQAYCPSKQITFDQLYQTNNIITLQKFMYFCKDFHLIDLEVTNKFVEQLGGKPVERKAKKAQFKKEQLILSKFLLVEYFKKNCSTQKELSFADFIQVLQKLANLMFESDQALYLMYEYLEVKDPKAYRKKMIIVGKPFNTKEQTEVVTQEKLYARRIVLPPKPRATSVNKDPAPVAEASPEPIPQPKKKTQAPKPDKNLLQWEDLESVPKDFDPKELLLEQDISDKEDEYYLKEYQLKKPKRTEESAKPKEQGNKASEKQIAPVSTKRPMNKIPTKAMLNQSYESSNRRNDEHLKKAELQTSERQKLIYQAFMKKQKEREDRVKRKQPN